MRLCIFFGQSLPQRRFSDESLSTPTSKIASGKKNLHCEIAKSPGELVLIAMLAALLDPCEEIGRFVGPSVLIKVAVEFERRLPLAGRVLPSRGLKIEHNFAVRSRSAALA